MEKLNKTLAEQLQISALEIEKRKQLLDFTDEDAETLHSFKPIITKYLDDIVKEFYDHQLKIPEISLLIGDAETFRRLSIAMHRYILDLFDGHYDEEYVNRRLRIGKVHQRIGVSSKLYLAAIYQLHRILDDTLLMRWKSDSEWVVREKVCSSLSKIIMFDVQLVMDTYFASLANQVENVRSELRNYSESLQDIVNEKTRQLKEVSLRDGLTGLYNHVAFYEHLRRELANAERYNETLTLFYLDLNNFKHLNDTEGHQQGDKFLIETGEVIRNAIRETDIACRYGGDEFCIILPRTTNESSGIIQDRLIKEFNKLDSRGVSFSLGVVDTGPDEYLDYESLVKNADIEMYKAKAASRKKPGIHISVSK